MNRSLCRRRAHAVLAIAAGLLGSADVGTGEGIRPGHALPAITFPSIVSQDLNGQTITVPDELNGQLRLLFVAYDRKDQKTVDPWLEVAKSWHLPEDKLGIYEIPIVKDPGKLMREFIDAGMRSGIPDRETRRRVITLYTDKAALLRQLAIPTDRTIDVLLLNSAGQVVWRTDGQLTGEKRQLLEAELASRLR